MMPDDIPHIPRYTIQSEIGSGSMAVVYLALDRLTQQPVALKLLKLSTLSDDKRSSLAHEFQTLASLRHPYIVSVLTYGFASDGTPFFAMDYLDKAASFVWAGQEQSTYTQFQLILQLLEGLAYLHRRGILHHDLKPGNILVVNNMVQVVDFGLSRLISRDQAGPSSGTLAYMPPEVLKKQSMTARGELFSVGILAYEMLKGAYPFPLSPAIAMINGILNTDLDFSQFGLPDRVVAILQKLVMKTPEDRYQSAQAVIDDLREALGLQQTDDRIPIRESYLQAASFVGRQTELDQLQTALSETQQGHNQVWLLGGESGVGKTRLVDEFRVQALIQGFEVLTGLAVEGGGLPFQVWREPVRRLLLSRPVDDLQAAILKEIVPDIEQLLDRPVATIPPLEGAAHQERLIFSIIDLLRYQQTSLLFILEDLQWAIESLEIIKQVLKVSDQIPRMMLLGTYRNDERPDLPQELPGVHILALDRLPDDAVNQLSQAILGKQGADPQLLSTLIQETEGNTFFIVEVMRAWAEEAGHLDQVGTGSQLNEVFTTGMHKLLQRRIQQVPHGDQGLLQLAAVTGRLLDLNILQALAPEKDINVWLQHISEAAVLSIIDGQWQFAHDKLRDTILVDLEDADRRKLHRQVAGVIEQIYPDDESHYEILLEHWHQADDLDKELYYLDPVVQHHIQYNANYAFARQLLQRGLQALQAEDVRRVSLLNWQAHSYMHQGNFAQTWELAHQAWELAQQLDDLPGIASSLNRLAMSAYRLGEYEQARDYFQQSLSTSRAIDDQHGIAMIFNNLGLMAFYQGEHVQAYDFYHQGLAILQSIDDQRGVAIVLSNLGLMTSHQGEHEQAHNYFSQSLSISQALGDHRAIAITLNHLGQLSYDQRDYIQSQRYFQQSLSISQLIGSQNSIAISLNRLGFVYLILRDKQSLAIFRESLAITQSIQSIPLILEALIGFAWIYLQQECSSYAAELAGLAQHHPAHNVDVHIRLNELMPELKQALDPADLQAALDQGKALDLETVINEILTDDA